MEREAKETNAWLTDAKVQFNDWTRDCEQITFEPKITLNGRCFGELFVENSRIGGEIDIGKSLCDNQLAIATSNYINYINSEF